MPMTANAPNAFSQCRQMKTAATTPTWPLSLTLHASYLGSPLPLQMPGQQASPIARTREMGSRGGHPGHGSGVPVQTEAVFMAWKKGWLLWGKGPWQLASSTPVYCSRIIRVLKGGRRLSFWKSGNATMQKWRRRKMGGERKNAHNSSEQDWAPGILTELFQQNRSGQTVLQAHAIGKITSLHRLRVEKENTKNRLSSYTHTLTHTWPLVHCVVSSWHTRHIWFLLYVEDPTTDKGCSACVGLLR